MQHTPQLVVRVTIDGIENPLLVSDDEFFVINKCI
jgi:hypothetical protein